MLNKIMKHLWGLAALVILLNPAALSTAAEYQGKTTISADRQARNLSNQVYNSIMGLPYYGVFDTISVSVEKGTVILTGKVSRPALKSEAEWAVENIDGVNEVVNQIEILPLSPMDDDLRRRAFSAIYLNPMLDRYGASSSRPIRIIVENGNITLVGVVDSTQDRNAAEMAIKTLPFVHSVTNELKVR
jgi:hyperosmotically inducible periplasmic protein